MNLEEKVTIVESFIDAFNQLDVNSMLQFVHPQIHFENVTDGVVNSEADGIEKYKELAEISMSFFESRKQKIKRVDIDGQKLMVNISFEGILAENLPNGLQVGDKIAAEGFSEYTFEGDKIIQLRDIN